MIDNGEDEDVELLLGDLDDTDLSPPVLKGAIGLWLAEHLSDARACDRPGGLLVARGRKQRMLLLGQTTCTVRVAYSADPEPGADLGVGWSSDPRPADAPGPRRRGASRPQPGLPPRPGQGVVDHHDSGCVGPWGADPP